jgi:hypothetical protein
VGFVWASAEADYFDMRDLKEAKALLDELV